MSKSRPVEGKQAAVQQWQITAKAKMKELGLSQTELSGRMSCSRPGLNHWLNGRRQPSPAELSKLAGILGLSVGELFSGNRAAVPGARGSIGKQAKVIVVTVVQCGIGGRWTQSAMQPTGNLGWAQVPSSDPDAYAVKIEGDGLRPVARDGWLLVVEPNTPPSVGEFAWIETVSGEWMVREFVASDVDSMMFCEVTGAPGRLWLPSSAMRLCCACYPLPPSKFIPG